MGSQQMSWAILIAIFYSFSAHGRVFQEGGTSPLSMIVKRQAEEVTPEEPQVTTSVAATQGSLLDVFSSSTKETKPLPTIIKSMHTISNITLRYAKTRIESKILNPANVTQEVFFNVIIPETSFISGFSMEIDGKVYNAYVKEKQEAQKVYDAAVKQGVTAGHVKQSARDSNRFSVSVNVEPQKKVRFNLTYEELLQRKSGSYRHIINLNPGQLVEDFSVDVYIQENREITGFRVPKFQSGNEVFYLSQSEDFDMATTERISPTEVKVSFKPSVEDQKSLRKKSSGDGGVLDEEDLPNGMSGQFAVEYDVARDPTGGEVLVSDTYFVHFFAPPDLPPLKKHVIFVLDVSGSMEGRKIQQLKQAMNDILDELNPGDFFNIIEFAFHVTVRDLDSPMLTADNNPWIMDGNQSNNNTEKIKPFPATVEYRKRGKEVVEKMAAAGGTNIYDALNTALEMAEAGIDKHVAKREVTNDNDGSFKPPEPLIIFLTDGEPTTGITSESKIIMNVDEKNTDPKIPIFSLAFGTDADFKLLKRISLVTNGYAKRIYEAADTSLQLKNFYKEISSPVLSKVKFVYSPEQVENETITKVDFNNFFGGSELIVAGKLKGETLVEDIGMIEAESAIGFKNYTINDIVVSPPVLKRERNYHPLERLWVYMTIKQLLNEAEIMKARSYLLDYKDEKKPLHLGPEEKALRLALEAVKKAVYSFFRIIIDCLMAKLKLLQYLFQYKTNDFVYVDSVPKQRSKSISDKIKELAVKYLRGTEGKKTVDMIPISSLVLNLWFCIGVPDEGFQYSFVCPLTSLVVVKPGSLTDADVELAAPTPVAAQIVPMFMYSAPGTKILPLANFGPAMKFGMPHAPSTMAFRTTTLANADPAPNVLENISSHLSTVDRSQGPIELSLDSITWLQQVLTGDTLRFPNDTDSTDYQLGRSQVDDSFGNCTVENFDSGASSTNASEGVCRHLEHCVLPEIVDSVDVYFNHFFCVIPGNYAGICCPSSAPANVQGP